MNYIKILKVVRRYSADTSYVDGRQYFHMTGEVECLCLACKKPFTTQSYNFNCANPERSQFSCGCVRRPNPNKGKLKGPRGPRDPSLPAKPPGPAPADLRDISFYSLTPQVWLKGRGWECSCACGETCIVRFPKQLLHGTIRACQACRPEDWLGKRGPKKGEGYERKGREGRKMERIEVGGVDR